MKPPYDGEKRDRTEWNHQPIVSHEPECEVQVGHSSQYEEASSHPSVFEPTGERTHQCEQIENHTEGPREKLSR